MAFDLRELDEVRAVVVPDLHCDSFALAVEGVCSALGCVFDGHSLMVGGIGCSFDFDRGGTGNWDSEGQGGSLHWPGYRHSGDVVIPMVEEE
jgi:hypothetical protein